MFDGRFRVQVEKVVRPVGETLRKTGLSPDHLTLLGMVVAVAAAVSIGAGALQLGLFLVICSALPDLLDGALAKASNSASQRGAFFDSVVDRVTDALLFGGVAWFFATTKDPRLSLIPFAIMGVSMLISYERAKAESLGLNAKGGLMDIEFLAQVLVLTGAAAQAAEAIANEANGIMQSLVVVISDLGLFQLNMS